jgi:alpha/beta superfamily hydrolase
LPRRIESHFLPGPAGRLEALLEEPEDREPLEAALVCHPHPLHGGTMHNKVVHRVARGLRRAGCVVLRFNFRGVNLSAGEHAHGAGERDDARAALAWLRERYPNLSYSLAGFSFGSRVILSVGCELPGVRRLIAAGFPTRIAGLPSLASCHAPKYFIQSTHDQYGPASELEEIVAQAADPKFIFWIAAQDHFFGGALEALEERVFAVVSEAPAPGTAAGARADQVRDIAQQ